MTNNTNYYRRNQTLTPTEPSLGELFADLSENATLLVKQEIQLAKAEMSQKAKDAGREIAIITIGGFLGNAALLTFVAGLVLLLGLWLPLWVAAFIVGLIVALVAGLMVWQGIQALKDMDPMPTQTIATIQEDKEWLTQQLN